MRTSIFFLAATAAALEPICNTDACYNAILGPGASSASSFCSANLPTATSTAFATSISTILATITDVVTLTDETTILQTLGLTEVDATTVTYEIDLTSTLISVVATSFDIETIIEKRAGQTLKKRKICTPKTSSSTSTTTTSSALANPTSICTDPSQIISACACLGITEPTVVQTSTIVLPSTLTNTIQATATQLLNATVILSSYTTLITTAVVLETSTIIDTIPITIVTTVSDIIQPEPSCFVVREDSSSPTRYLALDKSNPNSLALAFTNDPASAANFTMSPDSRLVSWDTSNLAYGTPGSAADAADTLGLTLASDALANYMSYTDLFFALRNNQGFPTSPPYQVGDNGVLLSTNQEGSFLDCSGDLYVSSGLVCGENEQPTSLFLQWEFVW